MAMTGTRSRLERLRLRHQAPDQNDVEDLAVGVLLGQTKRVLL